MDANSNFTILCKEITSSTSAAEEGERIRAFSDGHDDDALLSISKKSVITYMQATQQQDQLSHFDYQIALYYCYIPIANPADHVEFHQSLCEQLDLNGRIRVASEGINGVLSGKRSLLNEYAEALRDELQKLNPQENHESYHATSDDSSWELDVKFCDLRTDLPVLDQLFDSLSVKQTKAVVSLVGTSSSGGAPSGKKRRKWKQRNKMQQQESKKISDGMNNSGTISRDTEVAARLTEQIYAAGLDSLKPAQHLSPTEWNNALIEATAEKGSAEGKKTILLDCRNVYESNVGRFEAPGVDTMLTNTRKFSELPHVLVRQKERLQEADQIFMYCTGGVRCERASVFLQSLLHSSTNDSTRDEDGVNRANGISNNIDEPATTTNKAIPQIYQLRGGIQRYLESSIPTDPTPQTPSSVSSSLFRGKNFVFDPRRTDPLHDGSIVGTCLVCKSPHDDFDLGASPAQNAETRCWNCRILILVCPSCRPTVSCWNDAEKGENNLSECGVKPRLYCGGTECFHMPPVQIVSGE